MNCTRMMAAAMLTVALISLPAWAGDANFSLNLEFNDLDDFSSGGTWTAVAKVDDYGLAGASLYLSPAAIFGSFLAPPEYAVQAYSDFGGVVLNITVGDDLAGTPLIGAGVIGSSWPSNYPTEPNLAQFGGSPDLGSFAGGIALATGSCTTGPIPGGVAGLPGAGVVTDAGLSAHSTGPGPPDVGGAIAAGSCDPACLRYDCARVCLALPV